MKMFIMYTGPFVANFGTKAEFQANASWELFLDTGSRKNLVFGEVTSIYFVTKPTPRQIRKAKKAHRVRVRERIAEAEFADSWEGIHCDIIGL